MMAISKTLMTADEYLARESEASEKSILWDGEVYAMAGAMPDHNAIVANALAELGRVTRRGPCRVYASDLKVFVPLRAGFVYLDASVVCGPLELYGRSRDVIVNPTVLLEVLSEGTESFDRGDKASGYRAIPSLKHHVLVSQTERHVEVFTRQSDDAWLLREYRGSDEAAIDALGGALSLDELYLKVFDEP